MIRAIRHWFWLRQLSPFWREWLRADREPKSTIPLHRLSASPALSHFQRRRRADILSKILTLAEDNGMVASNHCGKVNKLRKDNRRTRHLIAEEEKRLMAALTGRRAYLKPINVLVINTGMRRGEILVLEWKNVDLTRGLIYVTNIPVTQVEAAS